MNKLSRVNLRRSNNLARTWHEPGRSDSQCKGEERRREFRVLWEGLCGHMEKLSKVEDKDGKIMKIKGEIVCRTAGAVYGM